MKLIQYLILCGLFAAIQGHAIAQGRPGGKSAAPPEAADHAHHGPAEPPPAARPAGRDWTRYPIILPVMGGDRDRETAAMAVKNSQATALEVIAPDLSAAEARRQVPLGPEGAKFRMLPKVGNSYWVIAREEVEGRIAVASTSAYFGNPGPAPTQLLLARKNELEIIPQPLPREHTNYRESEKWSFLLRFNGQPVPNKAVKMETELGTKTTFVSDKNGVATVLFPRDFKPADPAKQGGHQRGPQRAKFVLAVEHESEGRQYLTAFNATYSPDADRNRNLVAGVGFGLFGMLLATPLLRRKQEENNAAQGGRTDV